MTPQASIPESARFFRFMLTLALSLSAIINAAGIASAQYPTAPKVLRNPYRDVNWDKINHYLANLHCHTQLSDGRAEPGQLINAYAQAGYHILAITDHDNHQTTREGETEYPPTHETTWPWTRWIPEKPSRIWKNGDMETSAFYPDLGPTGMFAIRGNELTTHPHTVSLFNDCGYADAKQTDDERLSCVHRKGGLSYWAHPSDYVPGGRWDKHPFNESWDESLTHLGKYIAKYDSHLGIELQLKHRAERDLDLLDRLLMQYLRDNDVLIFGGDDNHNVRVAADESLTIILAENLTEEAVKRALASGHTIIGRRSPIYPKINRISVNEARAVIQLDIDNHDGITWFVNGKEHGQGNAISYADMNDAVVRFTIAVGDRTFYSQAFYIGQTTR